MKCLIAFGLLIALIGLPTTGGEAQSRRALIVTVGKYKDPDVNSIMPGGEQRDGQYMKIALKSQGITDFVELSTEKNTPPESYATLENIQRAMKRFQRETKPGDVVVFYYSGHGSRTGTHFTLCPYDASPLAAGNDIEDTVLADWVKSLPTNNITLLLDCCFTEYPTKDPVHRSKYLRREFSIAPEPLTSVFPQDKTVILKASRGDEEAQEEDETGTGKWVGVFTRWFCYELKMPSSRELTYTQLMERVDRDVQREVTDGFHKSFSQTPQLDGSEAQRNRRLFEIPPSDALQRNPLIPPHLEVRKLPGGSIGLNAGSDREVTEGSEYAIVSAKKPDMSRPTGKIRVSEVQNGRAIAKVVSGRGLRDGDFAIEILHKAQEADKNAFRVRIEGPPAVKADVEKALRASGHVEIVRNRPALVLQVEGQPDALVGRLFRSDGDNAYGEPMQQATAGSASLLAKAIGARIDNLAFLRSLVNLNNSNPGINLKIETEKTLHLFEEHFAVNLQALDQAGAQVDCYITVIDIDANGTPSIIFPKASDPNLRDNHLRRDSDGIPSTLKLDVHCFPPAGQDTMIAIATRQPIESLEELTAWQAAGNSGATSKGVDAIGAEIQRKPLNDWGKAVLNIVIVDPKDVDSSIKQKTAAETNKGRNNRRVNDKE